MRGVLIFLSFLLLASIVWADSSSGTIQTSCRLTTSCAANETCWIKLSNTTNAHVGSCSTNYTYSMCCTHTIAANIKTSCSAGEDDVLLLGGDGTISMHTGDFFSPYTNHLCVQPRSDTELSCQVGLKATNQPVYECFLGMSNTTNAHSETCENPPFNYSYSLGCHATERVITNHTVQVTMSAASTSDSVYVPGKGQQEYSQLQSASYTPPVVYIESSSGSKLFGMVGYAGAQQISTEKYAGGYALTMQLGQEPNKVALVFGKGDLSTFLNSVAILQQNSFDASSVDTFGFQTQGEETTVKQGVEYDQILFRGQSTLDPGTYQLRLEHLGTRDRKIILKVSQVS